METYQKIVISQFRILDREACEKAIKVYKPNVRESFKELFEKNLYVGFFEDRIVFGTDKNQVLQAWERQTKQGANNYLF